MRLLNSVLLSLLLSFTLVFAESHLMRYADVSRDHIVFTYEGDLWLVSINGGIAKRITRSDGAEIFAKFSPDGSKLAFTGNYDGGSDVYVMDINGSEPVRLTYHPAQDLVLDWFPDGKHILFRSRRAWPYRADMVYQVSLKGGMPEKLPVDRAGLATLSPDGKSIAYNRITREFRHWKRHKGGTAQDIWMGNFNKKDYHKITQYDGTDNFPMWYGSAIYFTSDREDGTLNIYKYDLKTGQISRMTHYSDYDVKYPSLGPGKIIYQYAETLYLLDLASGKIQKVDIEIPSDRTLIRSSYINDNRYVGGFGLSPKGKRAILEIRGEIVDIPADKGVPYNLTQSSASREKNPVWSPDGQWVAFFSDKTGEDELYITDPKGSADWIQLTSGNKGFRINPVWSPDSKYILFHDKFMQLNLVDVKTKKRSIIDKGQYDDAWERWGIQDYSWSPDSKWIAYSKMERSLYESIFLFSMKTGEIYRVTSTMTEDWSPSFSKDGRYLYFLSNRTFKPIMGFVDQNHIFLNMAKPYLVILKEGDPSPFRPKNIFDQSKDKKDSKRSKNLIVSTTGSGDASLAAFELRTIAAPVKSGNLFRLEAIKTGFVFLKKTENEFLKYQTVTDQNTGTNLDLYKFTFKKGKISKLMSGISQYHLSADAKRMIYKSGSQYGVVDLGKAKVGDGLLPLKKVPIKIDKQKEYAQVFDEAWRIERDWFYDKHMHGLDWKKVGDMYRRFIPYCGSRGDVNYLIGEMIAEINAGHTYVYGGDVQHPKSIRTGLLGAEFEVKPHSFPRIKRIIPTDNWDGKIRSPLYQPGCPVEKGDYILAIDGVKILPGDNIYKYLENKAGQVVELTYNRKPSFEKASTYLVKTLNSEYALRYHAWSLKNRHYVDRKTDHQVGYVHLPNMMQDGLIEFAKGFYPQYYKKGMIIDVRYNGGGFTSKQIHDRLERTINTFMQPREGKPTPVPERTFGGYLVLLINHDTGSDGELFSEAWKSRHLGPIIGQRTWGGAVGIEPHEPLIDNGTVTPPQFGEYNRNGHWVIEGHGVDPDILVVNLPADVLKGKDDQLDKAIEVILNEISTRPKTIFKKPVYPDKSKPSLK